MGYSCSFDTTVYGCVFLFCFGSFNWWNIERLVRLPYTRGQYL